MLFYCFWLILDVSLWFTRLLLLANSATSPYLSLAPITANAIVLEIMQVSLPSPKLFIDVFTCLTNTFLSDKTGSPISNPLNTNQIRVLDISTILLAPFLSSSRHPTNFHALSNNGISYYKFGGLWYAHGQCLNISPLFPKPPATRLEEWPFTNILSINIHVLSRWLKHNLIQGRLMSNLGLAATLLAFQITSLQLIGNAKELGTWLD